MRTPRTTMVHLELRTGDLPAAQAFYRGLCGWRTSRVDTPHGSYVALDLAPRVGGGIVEGPEAPPRWLPYVAVPDIVRATAAARELGAHLLLEPREGPAGWRSIVADPAAGELALWQPKR